MLFRDSVLLKGVLPCALIRHASFGRAGSSLAGRTSVEHKGLFPDDVRGDVLVTKANPRLPAGSAARAVARNYSYTSLLGSSPTIARTPKVCQRLAFRVILRGFGPLFYILLGSTCSQGQQPETSSLSPAPSALNPKTCVRKPKPFNG